MVTSNDGHAEDRESTPQLSQHDKFKELARELEADEDEARWDERLKKVAQHKPHDDDAGR
ncbi:MAG: hypothetical protein DI591_10935 [Citromicrobium sp.]|nr:MAG: hypothetical protein DI591_10935 [Citromicrobium sp.]